MLSQNHEKRSRARFHPLRRRQYTFDIYPDFRFDLVNRSRQQISAHFRIPSFLIWYAWTQRSFRGYRYVAQLVSFIESSGPLSTTAWQLHILI